MRNRKRVRLLTFAVLALMGTLLAACGSNGGADDEAHVLLIEHVGTPNTGDSAERAAAVEEEI